MQDLNTSTIECSWGEEIKTGNKQLMIEDTEEQGASRYLGSSVIASKSSSLRWKIDDVDCAGYSLFIPLDPHSMISLCPESDCYGIYYSGSLSFVIQLSLASKCEQDTKAQTRERGEHLVSFYSSSACWAATVPTSQL